VSGEKCIEQNEFVDKIKNVRDISEFSKLVEQLLRSVGVKAVSLESSAPDGSFSYRKFEFLDKSVKYVQYIKNDIVGRYIHEEEVEGLSELYLVWSTLYQLLKCYTRKCYNKNIKTVAERLFGPEPDTIYCY